MPPAGERPVKQMRDVARVAVQPAFRLDEIEEEHAREGRERERVAIEMGARRSQAVGQVQQRGAECAEEAGCDALAGQHFADAQRQRQRRFIVCGDEPFQRGECGA